MELVVKREKVTQVGVLGERGLEKSQLLDHVLAEMRNALRQGKGLEALAHLVNDRQLVLIEHRHTGALVRLKLDEALGCEHAQGFAHGQSAGTELLGEVLLEEALARCHLAGEDARAQVDRDLFADR